MFFKSTNFLRLAVICLGLVAIPFWTVFNFNFARILSAAYPVFEPFRVLLVCWVFAGTIPFYYTLFQTMKLLSAIDKNTAFSDSTVKILNKIKKSATIMGLICYMGMPIALLVSRNVDPPGLPGIAFGFASVPIAIAALADVLKKLLQKAIDLKNENDLTV